MTSNELPAGYTIRELSAEVFLPLWRQHRDRLFPGLGFRLDPPPDPASTAADPRNVERWRVAFGLFEGDEFVGWTLGHQLDGTRFEMYNSAVFEAHRGRRLYRALVLTMTARVFAAGFTTILSRHHPSNSAVLVAKLKCGFVVSGIAIDPSYGTLVELSRYATELHHAAFDYRVGLAPMSDELAAVARRPG